VKKFESFKFMYSVKQRLCNGRVSAQREKRIGGISGIVTLIFNSACLPLQIEPSLTVI
jgi:hypothetical protein